ncbi:MAG: hypothetical protein AABX91_00665 [Nanoarchaeota archaeon]
MSNRGLSFLASTAAVFLECHAGGIEMDEGLNMVGYLSEEMDYVSKNPSIENSAMLLRFIWPNQRDWKGRTTEDIYLHVNLLAKDLKYFKELPKRKQQELSGICLMLSEAASMRSIYDLGL